jgi:hypothetical protein
VKAFTVHSKDTERMRRLIHRKVVSELSVDLSNDLVDFKGWIHDGTRVVARKGKMGICTRETDDDNESLIFTLRSSNCTGKADKDPTMHMERCKNCEKLRQRGKHFDVLKYCDDNSVTTRPKSNENESGIQITKTNYRYLLTSPSKALATAAVFNKRAKQLAGENKNLRKIKKVGESNEEMPTPQKTGSNNGSASRA